MTDRELSHPHDLLVRHFLVEPDLMADLISHYVDPGIVSLLDLDALKCESPVHINEKLVQRAGDVRFRTKFKGTGTLSNVFVFFEHQSTSERMFPFRLLEYMMRTWRTHLDTHPTGLLPYPVVIVLYHGKKPWSKFPVMSDLIESVPGVDRYILNFPIHLIDLSTIPMDQIKGHPALRALFESLQSASTGKLEERFDHVMDHLTKAKADARIYDWLSTIIHYTMSLCRPENAEETIFRAYRKLIDEEEARKMATSFVAELLDKGEAKGLKKGRMEGRVEGRVEGRWEGKAEGILAFLEARFGSVPKPVQNAVLTCTDLTKLDALIRLAATCESIDEFRQGLPQV